MIRHLAGEPVDGVQRCRWCGLVLVGWSDEQVANVLDGEPRGAFFFPVNTEVVHEGPFMGTNVHQQTGELVDTESPLCVPDIEGVNIE